MISNNQTGNILSIYLTHIFVISILEISIYDSKYNAIHNVYSVVETTKFLRVGGKYFFLRIFL